MALRFIDSFGHYSISLAYRKWTIAPGGSMPTSGGRRGGPYLIPNGNFYKTLTPTNNYTMGAAFFVNSTNTPYLHTIGNGGYRLGSVVVNADYTLTIVSSPQEGGGTNIFTSTQAITQDVWNYIEVSFLLTGGTGTLSLAGTLYVNGDLWGSGTGTCGITGASLLFPGNYANQAGVFIGPGGTLGGVQDFYCLDTSTTDINGNATTNTTFLGDIEVDSIFPAADVAVTWGTVGGDGTHVYTCINESIPDDDTSYVFSSNTGTIESFTYTPITGFSGTIFGAQYLACMKKDAEGLREAALTLGGTPQASSNFATTTGFNTSTQQFLSDYYVYYIAPMDSANGIAWTTGVFNTSTFGVEVTV